MKMRFEAFELYFSLTLSWRISFNMIFLSSGCLIHGIFVRYNLLRFCAETREELISIGSTHNSFEIMSCRSFFIFTFSKRKYFGLTSFKILTYSKNNQLLESWKFFPFHALENHWHGDHQINKSKGHSQTIQSSFIKYSHQLSQSGVEYRIFWTSQISTMSSWFFFAILIAFSSISLAKYSSTLIHARTRASYPQAIQSNKDKTFIYKLAINKIKTRNDNDPISKNIKWRIAQVSSSLNNLYFACKNMTHKWIRKYTTRVQRTHKISVIFFNFKE